MPFVFLNKQDTYVVMDMDMDIISCLKNKPLVSPRSQDRDTTLLEENDLIIQRKQDKITNNLEITG